MIVYTHRTLYAIALKRASVLDNLSNEYADLLESRFIRFLVKIYQRIVIIFAWRRVNNFSRLIDSRSTLYFG